MKKIIFLLLFSTASYAQTTINKVNSWGLSNRVAEVSKKVNGVTTVSKVNEFGLSEIVGTYQKVNYKTIQVCEVNPWGLVEQSWEIEE